MKLIIFFSFVFISLLGANTSSLPHSNNFLTIVIMVKNEANVIVPTLQPFIDAGIKNFLVFDTGSTDGTQEIIKKHFKSCSLKHAHIIEEPFIDFASSRNRALELAENIFPQSTFFLMLDAEWYIHNVKELLEFCALHKNYTAPGYSGSCYLIRLFTQQDSINNYVPRLFRNGCKIRYEGAVHETILDEVSGIVPDVVYFEYAPQKIGKEKSQARLIRDYDLLKKSYEKDPTNTRTLFYLGQTCQFLNDWQQALFFYQKRLEIGDMCEEKYLAAYRCGYAIEYILQEANNENVASLYAWEDALSYYLKAHGMLPYRAEPLFRIACYYIRTYQHAIAYLFALRAAQLPYPNNNGLFIEKRIYDFLRYDILGQCALYVGEYAIGKMAVLKAMELEPDNPCLEHNLGIYNYYLSS